MSEPQKSAHPQNPAARPVVFVLSIAFFAVAIAAYFHEPPGVTMGVYIPAAIAGGFLLLALFGSSDACDTTVHVLTLGAW